MKTKRVAVVGLGYVGLPLAVEFGKTKLAPIIGFDVDREKIEELKVGYDRNGELRKSELQRADIEYTADPTSLQKSDFIIVAVPTPITEKTKEPDLSLLKSASKTVGQNLSQGTIVVFESTVYPGVTEEICVPIIEKWSKKECGKEWSIGYSPERVNPGDKEHTIDKIIKVVSGMDEETLEEVAEVYSLVCKAGVHKTPDIKTAEAAKVIENVQRDLNIALINELSNIFNRLGITTKDVIEAAGTKWNFHKYQPGLVGGHCIGVDPYYLTHCAKKIGYEPQVILAGRKTNDAMPLRVAHMMIEMLKSAGHTPKDAAVLILGLTFKEDIKDTRNSKIIDTINTLKAVGIRVFGHDPNLSKEEVIMFNVEPVIDLKNAEKVEGIILAAPHKQFKKASFDELIAAHYNRSIGTQGVLIDIKSWFLPRFQEKGLETENILYKCL